MNLELEEGDPLAELESGEFQNVTNEYIATIKYVVVSDWSDFLRVIYYELKKRGRRQDHDFICKKMTFLKVPCATIEDGIKKFNIKYPRKNRELKIDSQRRYYIDVSYVYKCGKCHHVMGSSCTCDPEFYVPRDLFSSFDLENVLLVYDVESVRDDFGCHVPISIGFKILDLEGHIYTERLRMAIESLCFTRGVSVTFNEEICIIYVGVEDWKDESVVPVFVEIKMLLCGWLKIFCGITKFINLFIVSFNGSRYDEIFFMKETLERLDVNRTFLIQRANSVKIFTFRDESGVVKIFDINQHLLGSLDSIAKDMKLINSKLPFPYETLNDAYANNCDTILPLDDEFNVSDTRKFFEIYEGSMVKAMLIYLTMDVKITVEIALQLQAKMQILVNNAVPGNFILFKHVTSPTFAFSFMFAYLTHMGERNEFFIPNGKLYEFINESVLGGRSETFIDGVINTHLAYVDINSHYPNSMKGLYPTGKYKYVDRCRLRELQAFISGKQFDRFGWVCLRLSAVNNNNFDTFPPLAVRTKQGLSWCMNYEKIVCTKPDIILLSERGYDVQLVDDYCNIETECEKHCFQKFINYLQDLKISAPDDTIKKFAKLMLNSLYGKTIERVIPNDVRFVSTHEMKCMETVAARTPGIDISAKCSITSNTHMISVKRDSIHRANENRLPIQIGSTLLAHSRNILQCLVHLIRCCYGNSRPLIFYCDTDSIIFRYRHLDAISDEYYSGTLIGDFNGFKPTFFIKDELGTCSCFASGKRRGILFGAIGPKSYCIVPCCGQVIFRCKGQLLFSNKSVCLHGFTVSDCLLCACEHNLPEQLCGPCVYREYYNTTKSCRTILEGEKYLLPLVFLKVCDGSVKMVKINRLTFSRNVSMLGRSDLFTVRDKLTSRTLKKINLSNRYRLVKSKNFSCNFVLPR